MSAGELQEFKDRLKQTIVASTDVIETDVVGVGLSAGSIVATVSLKDTVSSTLLANATATLNADKFVVQVGGQSFIAQVTRANAGTCSLHAKLAIGVRPARIRCPAPQH